MLQRLAEELRECLEGAAQSEARAADARDPHIQREYLEMAARWRSLARSIEFCQAAQTFLMDADKRRAAMTEQDDK